MIWQQTDCRRFVLSRILIIDWTIHFLSIFAISNRTTFHSDSSMRLFVSAWLQQRSTFFGTNAESVYDFCFSCNQTSEKSSFFVSFSAVIKRARNRRFSSTLLLSAKSILLKIVQLLSQSSWLRHLSNQQIFVRDFQIRLYSIFIFFIFSFHYLFFRSQLLFSCSCSHW